MLEEHRDLRAARPPSMTRPRAPTLFLWSRSPALPTQDAWCRQNWLGHSPLPRDPHQLRPAAPSSTHPLTKAWVVGKGCRSRGFGNLGIRSSGSTLTYERQVMRHTSTLQPWCDTAQPLPGATAPGQIPAGKPRLGAPNWRGITRQSSCKCRQGPVPVLELKGKLGLALQGGEG